MKIVLASDKKDAIAFAVVIKEEKKASSDSATSNKQDSSDSSDSDSGSDDSDEEDAPKGEKVVPMRMMIAPIPNLLGEEVKYLKKWKYRLK